MAHNNYSNEFQLRVDTGAGFDIIAAYDNGRITSPARASFTDTVEEMTHRRQVVNEWLAAVLITETPSKTDPPDTPFKENYDHDANTISIDVRIGSLKSKLTYNKTTKEIQSDSRPDFNISFAGFLYYGKVLDRFLALIAGQWL